MPFRLGGHGGVAMRLVSLVQAFGVVKARRGEMEIEGRPRQDTTVIVRLPMGSL